MDEKSLNELRCVAAEIIVKLYEAGSASQLKLLKMQVDRSLEALGASEDGDEETGA
jgi:hypothetical protein